MTTVNIYLTFNGNCEEAFTFYASVFNVATPHMGRFKDIPPGEGMTTTEADAEKIMHATLQISKETNLMGSDTGSEWAAGFKQGNNFSIAIGTDDRAEAELMFNKLSEGGAVTMPMNDTFWGDYFGMLTDKFGINWMVSYNKEQHANAQ
jgi:PhnB protein